MGKARATHGQREATAQQRHSKGTATAQQRMGTAGAQQGHSNAWARQRQGRGSGLCKATQRNGTGKHGTQSKRAKQQGKGKGQQRTNRKAKQRNARDNRRDGDGGHGPRGVCPGGLRLLREDGWVLVATHMELPMRRDAERPRHADGLEVPSLAPVAVGRLACVRDDGRVAGAGGEVERGAIIESLLKRQLTREARPREEEAWQLELWQAGPFEGDGCKGFVVDPFREDKMAWEALELSGLAGAAAGRVSTEIRDAWLAAGVVNTAHTIG